MSDANLEQKTVVANNLIELDARVAELERQGYKPDGSPQKTDQQFSQQMTKVANFAPAKAGSALAGSRNNVIQGSRNNVRQGSRGGTRLGGERTFS
jgi:hypothetical protein